MNKTICYPEHLLYRKNSKYWFRLKTGRYVVNQRANIFEVVRVWHCCKAENLTFKIEARSKICTTLRVLLLYLFYNRINDRKPGDLQ